MSERQKAYSLQRAKEIVSQYENEVIGLHPYPSVMSDFSLDEYVEIATISELQIEQVSDSEFIVIAFAKNENGVWKREINDLLFSLNKITELIP